MRQLLGWVLSHDEDGKEAWEPVYAPKPVEEIIREMMARKGDKDAGMTKGKKQSGMKTMLRVELTEHAVFNPPVEELEGWRYYDVEYWGDGPYAVHSEGIWLPPMLDSVEIEYIIVKAWNRQRHPTEAQLRELDRRKSYQEARRLYAAHLPSALKDDGQKYPCREDVQRAKDIKPQRIDRLQRDVRRMGISCFGSSKRLNLWLDSPSPVLGGVTPRSLMDTAEGLELVLKEIGRIEHGIIS